MAIVLVKDIPILALLMILSYPSLQVENVGPDPVLEVLLPFPDHQAKNMAYLAATTNEGKGKSKSPTGQPPH